MNESQQIKSENMSDLERARILRQEAELLERKEAVRGRLRQLIEISKDPYYDQYLVQMMKDLDVGKATPDQVEREAERSYAQYRQRMAQAAAGERAQQGVQMPKKPVVPAQPMTQSQIKAEQPQKQSGMEFKVGIHVFSLIGAAFVLTAFVIFSNRFMNGFWQGICLYLAAAGLVILSELFLNKRPPGFSHVITGIGVGGLYAANMANYLALHTVNGIVAMAITLMIALATLALSQKKDSTVIRIIGLLGCYISFFPIKGFGTELNFLMTGLMILAINLISAFLQNQKNQELLNIIHVVANLIFTTLMLIIAAKDDVQSLYRALYVIMSFAFAEILCLRQYKKGQNGLLITGYIVSGIHLMFLLFLVPVQNVSDAEALFIRLIVEALVVLISIGIFVLWDKEDDRRFSQIYYIVLTVLFLSSVSNYRLEIILTVIGMFLLTRLLSQNRELLALDCIAAVWTAGAGIWYADHWYGWLFSGALLIGLLFVSQIPVIHEVLTTVALLSTWMVFVNFSLSDLAVFKENENLSVLLQNIGFPVAIAGLLLLFLLFNHWKWLRKYNQKPYNIFQVILTASLYSYFWIFTLIRKMIADSIVWDSGWHPDRNWIVAALDAARLVLGVLYILIALRKRYGLGITGKHWILTGFLIISILTGHYGTPVVVSILLMIVALGCVGFGFRLRDKSERICGLVLAVIVCLKLVLYDFREVSDMYRVIVFLAVGIIALVISFTYIQLEKSIDKQKIKSEQKESEPSEAKPEQEVMAVPETEAETEIDEMPEAAEMLPEQEGAKE